MRPRSGTPSTGRSDRSRSPDEQSTGHAATPSAGNHPSRRSPAPTPWLPDIRPTTPGPVSANASVMVGARDWMDERLLDQRVIALAGELDDEAVNRTVAALALLDSDGDEPIQLRLSGVSAVMTSVLPIVDALDLTGVPIHATALGTLTGPAIALLAVAGRRTAGPHALFQLREPRAPRGEHGRDVERLGRRACTGGRPGERAARGRVRASGGGGRRGHAGRDGC